MLHKSRHSAQSFIWCHHLLIRIGLLGPAPVVDHEHRKETGTVEVEVGIKIVIMVLVRQIGTCLWDV